MVKDIMKMMTLESEYRRLDINVLYVITVLYFIVGLLVLTMMWKRKTDCPEIIEKFLKKMGI